MDEQAFATPEPPADDEDPRPTDDPPAPVPDDPPAPATDDAPAPATDETTELIALIDRLEGVLDRSGLAELEVGSGSTTLVLRSAASISPATLSNVPAGAAPSTERGEVPAADGAHGAPGSSGHHAVVAPLTGIYYAAPSPDAAPYVRVGAQVVVGQVIGLIEAMKLYNEIKSDVAGRVIRLAAENGKLVKARQALIEVEPS